MFELTPEHFDKLSQLRAEMAEFPPDYFTEENILSWSKYFGVAPQDLHDYTVHIERILLIAENLARKNQGIEALPTEDLPSSRKLNPLPALESFHFLWLQTLLILMPQTDASGFDAFFSPYFKMACCLENTEELMRDLKLRAEHHGLPFDLCQDYNLMILFHDELKIAIQKQDLSSAESIYKKIYLLNQHVPISPEKSTLLKKASPSLRESFLVSMDTPVSENQEAESISTLETQENFEHLIREKLKKISEELNEKELSSFKDLDLKMDEIQTKAFASQLKNFLSKTAEAVNGSSPKNLAGSAA
jgi:hypothetical protein